MIGFADSIHPELINPAEFSHVAAYANGLFQWPQAEVERFPYHVMIGVKSGDAAQAQVARVLDIERFDAVPNDFPPFATYRVALGHPDPTAYTSIEPDAKWGLAAVLAAIEAAGMQAKPWRLWIAWWWGRPFPPTASEVLAEIKTLTGLVVEPRRLWACQWQNGTQFDSSVLYQRDDFTRKVP